MSTTFFSTVVVITMLPRALFGLFVGPVVDEGQKKKILIYTELGQAICILFLFLIYKFGFNQFQFLFFLFLHSTFSLFNYPTMSSLIPLMLGENDLRKANSLMGITDSISLLLAPVLGGAIVFYNKLDWIFVIDIVSFAINVFFIKKTVPYILNDKIGKLEIITSFKEGINFFKQESILTKFLIISTITNFSLSLSFYLTPALLLMISNDSRIVGIVQTIGGVSQLIAIWIIGFRFKPKKLARSELIGTMIFAVLGPILISLSTLSLVTYIGYVLALLILPLLNVWNRTLWQSKVPKNMLGRVFATKRFISSFMSPIVTLCSGLIIDQFLIKKLQISKINSFKILFLVSGVILVMFSLLSLNSNWRKKIDAEII